MSIINEALKRAQNEKNPASHAHQTTGIDLQAHKKHGFNWGPVFVLTVLFLIAGPILLPLFITPFKRQAYLGSSSEKTALVGQISLPDAQTRSPQNPTAAAANMTRKSQFNVEEAPRGTAPSLFRALNPAPAKTAFNLSGIVYSPQESYCIINDQIVKVGEFIGGAKLLGITSNKVTLDYQGRAIFLVQ